ncbi:choline dehydrogenase, mitochondrial [Lepeophtheirus salmonis]|uniref:choline dehydrogenase, mitochondrial n=1 Tax=Lepeophtheirus salmonis TaxID=72036 RepID=UPI001AE6219E|nr:choline dehydrogenase, mitochondrial-like [Lepeophtheirus salmonis]
MSIVLRKVTALLLKGRHFGTSISKQASPSAKLLVLDNLEFKPEAIIFDKDGTLVCFHTMWTPWCQSFANRMNDVSGLDLACNLFEVLGYDQANSKVKLGSLAENTHPQLKEKVKEMLTNHPQVLCEFKAKEYLNQSWRDTPDNMDIKLTGNLHDLFMRLRSQGIHIAICTSDSRSGTEEFLDKENLGSLVDIVVCGDDSFSKPKPDPHNAIYICNKLNIDPSKTVMVGDTPADTIMGQAAGLGLTVGVLSGVGSAKDLMDADIIVDDVKDCVDLFLPHDPDKVETHRVTSRGLFKIASKGNFSQPRGSRGLSTYSHIVVGAGSAGCVLSNRLTEKSSNSIFLLEAGPKDTFLGSCYLQWKIHMPAALMYNLCDDKYNWYYNTLPQKHMNNRSMYWPRGRVWGGSSSLNAMVYIRGHAEDQNRWESEGAEGWNYQNCLPYFKKAQTHECGPSAYRGGNGPLHVSRGTSNNSLHSVWLEAGQQAGYPFTDDVNGYQQEGMSQFEMTIKKGMRNSTASAYLRPALSRPNLTTEVGALVTRILFDGKRAIGIEYLRNGKELKRVYADEVILSGGSINSPQLLMLSGVGPAQHLKEMDIPLVADIQGVGQNLQDHLEVYVVQECKKPITLLKDQKGLRMIQVGLQWFYNQTGSASTTHLESGGFVRSRPDVSHPNIMFHFLPSQVIDHGRQSPKIEAYQVHVGPMRSSSRGWIQLKSKDPRDHPIIQPNYLSTDFDVHEMRESVRLSRNIFAQPAFDPYRGIEIAPGHELTSDKDIDAFIRDKADSAYHPSCTCKMGSTSDNMTVVDPCTRVVGLEGLRVVDASIMPSIASGNLNAPTIMIAERAADIIKGDGVLPPAQVPVYSPPRN